MKNLYLKTTNAKTLLLAVILFSSIVTAFSLEKEICIKVNKGGSISFFDATKQLMNKSEYTFLYDLPKLKEILIKESICDSSISSLLNKVLVGKGLQAKIDGDIITFVKAEIYILKSTTKDYEVNNQSEREVNKIQNKSNNNFSYKPSLCGISGTILKDTRNCKKPAVDVAVKVYDKEMLVIDSTTTDANGCYEFKGIQKGELTIKPILDQYCDCVFVMKSVNKNKTLVHLNSEEYLQNQDFIIKERTGKLYGKILIDKDGDNIGDRPKRNYELNIVQDKNENGVFDFGEETFKATTDRNAKFSFENLSLGRYILIDTLLFSNLREIFIISKDTSNLNIKFVYIKPTNEYKIEILIDSLSKKNVIENQSNKAVDIDNLSEEQKIIEPDTLEENKPNEPVVINDNPLGNQSNEQISELPPNKQASFKGGDKELIDYIYKNIEYPRNLLRARKEGKVIYRLVISEKGEVSNVEIIESSNNKLFDKAGKKLIKYMPKFNPAILKGYPVACFYYLPINFNSDEYLKAIEIEYYKHINELVNLNSLIIEVPSIYGEYDAFFNLLNKIKMPRLSIKAFTDKLLIFKFSILNNGNTSNFEISNSAGDKLNKQLIEIMENLPNWNPAKIDYHSNPKKIDMEFEVSIKLNFNKSAWLTWHTWNDHSIDKDISAKFNFIPLERIDSNLKVISAPQSKEDDLNSKELTHIENSISGYAFNIIGKKRNNRKVPVEDAIIRLYEDTDNDGILDDTEKLIDLKTTNKEGFYQFINLPNSNYIVSIYENMTDKLSRLISEGNFESNFRKNKLSLSGKINVKHSKNEIKDSTNFTFVNLNFVYSNYEIDQRPSMSLNNFEDILNKKIPKAIRKIDIKYVVTKEGRVRDLEIIKGRVGCNCTEEELIRELNNLPKWSPGKIDGFPVDSYVTSHIKFSWDDYNAWSDYKPIETPEFKTKPKPKNAPPVEPIVIKITP